MCSKTTRQKFGSKMKNKIEELIEKLGELDILWIDAYNNKDFNKLQEIHNEEVKILDEINGISRSKKL